MPAERPASRRPADEHGQVTILVVGFAVFLAVAVAVVVDATAAYLQRQALGTLADGAALHGADLGATGIDIYESGVPEGRLQVTAAQAHAAVRDYLVDVGAHRRYPGLRHEVTVDPSTDRVTVRLTAPLELPLTFPGSPDRPSVGATGSAVSGVDAP